MLFLYSYMLHVHFLFYVAEFLVNSFSIHAPWISSVLNVWYLLPHNVLWFSLLLQGCCWIPPLSSSLGETAGWWLCGVRQWRGRWGGEHLEKKNWVFVQLTPPFLHQKAVLSLCPFVHGGLFLRSLCVSVCLPSCSVRNFSTADLTTLERVRISGKYPCWRLPVWNGHSCFDHLRPYNLILNIHNICHCKTILSVQFSGIYIHTVVQRSPPGISLSIKQ